MDINELISIVKKKIEKKIEIKNIIIEDKSFLHKNHVGNQQGKFHLKITLSSIELKKMGRINSNKKVYSLISDEIKKYIHSVQILII